MRLRDQLVIFDRDPAFMRFLADPSGSVLHVVRIWVACQNSDPPTIRRATVAAGHYWRAGRYIPCQPERIPSRLL
jgi:hypothetical protein